MSAHPDVHCERCGTVVETEWIDVSTLSDREPRYVEGQRQPCPTEGCGTTRPTCRRPEGDIHGPECGPVMAHKADDPTRVSRDDCLAVTR